MAYFWKANMRLARNRRLFLSMPGVGGIGLDTTFARVLFDQGLLFLVGSCVIDQELIPNKNIFIAT